MLQKKSFYHMNDHKISKWGYKMDQYIKAHGDLCFIPGPLRVEERTNCEFVFCPLLVHHHRYTYIVTVPTCCPPQAQVCDHLPYAIFIKDFLFVKYVNKNKRNLKERFNLT